MTTFVFVQHAAAQSPSEVLLGRNIDVGLSAVRLEQATRLSRHLRRWPISAIWSSPLARTMETAAVIARDLTLPVQVCHSLNEIDYDEWTGCSVAELASDRLWQSFNTARGQPRYRTEIGGNASPQGSSRRWR